MGECNGKPVGGPDVTVREELSVLNPDALMADGFDDAAVGYTEGANRPLVAVYDIDKCIEILVARDGIDRERAEDFLYFNTIFAHVGENGPLFVRFST